MSSVPSEARSTQQDDVSRIEIPTESKSIVCERRGASIKPDLIFTHGAESGIFDPPTRHFAEGFARHSTITSFQGTLSLQARIRAFSAVAKHQECTSTFGGRSMGARAAVLAAIEQKTRLDALILVSYPLRAGKRGENREYERREKILLDLPEGIDVLFIIGSEDMQCRYDDLMEMRRTIKPRSWLLEVVGADHILSLDQEGSTRPIRASCGTLAAEWLRDRDADKTYRAVSWDQDHEGVVADQWRVSRP